jgi:Tol biopolymer transport system component
VGLWEGTLLGGNRTTMKTFGSIFRFDQRDTNITTRVSIATDGTESNGSSYSPVTSVDGRYIAYYSGASNLTAGDTNGEYDVFVYDTNTSVTTMVSVATDGTVSNGSSSGPSISPDGKHITFESNATNLVAGYNRGIQNIYVRGE